MIEYLGLLYTGAKSLKEYLTWDEDQRAIDSDWLTKSGFLAAAEAKGMKLHWFNPDRIASGELDGWEVVYSIEKGKRIKHKLVRRDGQVLMWTRK